MDSEKYQKKEREQRSEARATALDLLALGKRAGLTFDEMNQLRVRDLVGIVEAYTGDGEDGGAREASQADVDAFYSSNF